MSDSEFGGDSNSHMCCDGACTLHQSIYPYSRSLFPLLQGKHLFLRAKELARLDTELTAAMGKRTKYQQSDFAQMFLFARSFLVTLGGGESAGPVAIEGGTGLGLLADSDACDDAGGRGRGMVGGSEAKTDHVTITEGVDRSGRSIAQCEGGNGVGEEGEGWQHSKWELGRRLVCEAAGGEEAAVREILLDETDGGPRENILFEGGPKFSEADLDRGGGLHELDQAIILALCLDVENNNPKDGLTAEEMFPYLQRVLGSPKNWMIHSTALLERSWLEYEKRRTADR